MDGATLFVLLLCVGFVLFVARLAVLSRRDKGDEIKASVEREDRNNRRAS